MDMHINIPLTFLSSLSATIINPLGSLDPLKIRLFFGWNIYLYAKDIAAIFKLNITEIKDIKINYLNNYLNVECELHRKTGFFCSVHAEINMVNSDGSLLIENVNITTNPKVRRINNLKIFVKKTCESLVSKYINDRITIKQLDPAIIIDIIDKKESK